ncbi:ABC transporter substrate-binding protein [Paenibacillus sp.]|uniref:ABC transporter substrate-binding protein n=1 Tax=Paenibacillus sp. TaxID=58172 RepID=UPI002D760BED|nr:ABC transporter substrate-binding protein [Paenibacillus sp.]HZG56321.1 ABC transporter substrate-binding protein [Paenibacillus sp.]
MLTACAEKPPALPNGAAGEGGAAAEKRELVLAVGAEPEAGFDPTTGWGRYGSPLFQSTLLKYDKDLQIVTDLATSYRIGEGGTAITVELRADAKFSDGMPVTAEDVKYTFETAAAGGSVVDLHLLERVEASDARTVTFTLKHPQSAFVHVLAATGIVPKHAHGADYAQRPIGSGPFRLVQWDRGQQLIVSANPLYYGEKPVFEKLTFLFLQEDAAFAAAQAGLVDIAAVPALFSRQTVPGMRLESLRSVDNRGILFPYVKSGAATADGYPIGNDVTSDLAIRKAINVAVDRQALIDGVLEGRGTPAYTSADGLPWWNPETVIADGDLDEAARILADGGWADADGDGIVEKDARKAEFALLYPAGDATRQSLAIAVADMMKPLGIEIRAEGKSWDDIGKLMYSNAVVFGWGSHDPLEMYNLYSGTNAGVEYFNTGFYANETVERYFEQALRAETLEEANAFWKKAQWDGETGFSARGDAPWAWLVNLDHLYLVDERLDIGEQKIHPHGHGWPVTDNIETWRWHE